MSCRQPPYVLCLAAVFLSACSEDSKQARPAVSVAPAGATSASPVASASTGASSPVTSGSTGASPLSVATSSGGPGLASASSASAASPLFSRTASYAVVLPSGDEADVIHPSPTDLGSNPNYAFPVAVFLQGANVDKSHYGLVAQRIAAYGFVVVVPNHRNPIMRGLYSNVGRVTDGLAWARAEATDPASPLVGALDTTRLAALGHSFGGLAALNALADRNVMPVQSPGYQRPAELACAVVFGTTTAFMGRVPTLQNAGRPVCFVQGDLDGLANPENAWKSYRAVADPPMAFVTIRGANHYLPADVNDPPGARTEPQAPTLSKTDGLDAAGRWAGAFLRAHLYADPAASEAVYVAGAVQDPNAEVASLAEDPQGFSLQAHVVDSGPSAEGPAFAAAKDLNGDGRLDLVVSKFGPFRVPIPAGEVTVYTQGTDLSQWGRSDVLTPADGVHFPNAPTVADVDADGDLDLIIPAGFLATEAIPLFGFQSGRLLWMERTANDWVRHDLVSGSELFYHRAALADLDQDGLVDLVTVGERKPLSGPEEARARWFRGTANSLRFETTPREIGDGLGSLPSLWDLDGDGDLDLASAEFFNTTDSFAWFEQTAPPSLVEPAGRWQRHVIDSQSGPSIQLSLIPDLYGDGVMRAVGSNHTNTAAGDPWESAVYVFDVPSDPRQPWPKTQISSGIRSRANGLFAKHGAPGLFGHGDLDGDGDVDLVVSGDGDARVYWLEQLGPGRFATHRLLEGVGQAGVLVVDLDADGRSEIVVTGYEDNEVIVLERP